MGQNTDSVLRGHALCHGPLWGHARSQRTWCMRKDNGWSVAGIAVLAGVAAGVPTSTSPWRITETRLASSTHTSSTECLRKALQSGRDKRA